MKPDTREAMHQLIERVRAAIPFDMPEASLCAAECHGCSVKLLAYLEGELDGWALRLDQGEIPDFGDLQRLGRQARKIHRALVESGLVDGDQ